MFGVVAFCFSPVGGIVRVLYIRFVLLEGFSGVGGVEPGVEFGYEVFAVAFFGEFDGVGSGVGDGLFGVFVVGGVGGSAYFVGEVEGYFGGEGFAAVVGGEGVVDGVGVYGVCSSESGGGEGEFLVSTTYWSRSECFSGVAMVNALMKPWMTELVSAVGWIASPVGFAGWLRSVLRPMTGEGRMVGAGVAM